MDDSLRNIKAGGRAHQFYMNHRAAILGMYAMYGREYVKEQIGIGDDALDRLIQSEKNENPAFEQSSRALAIAELANAKAVALGKSIAEVQRALDSLPDTLSHELGKRLFGEALKAAKPEFEWTHDISMKVPEVRRGNSENA